jgi:hypothetical protein
MPEHDTYDLDAAFARLEQDIAGVSSPRGASLAVSTARRRRRTTIGATVAGLALVVGAVAVGAGGRGHASVEPASSLPTPAALDAAALTRATQGWTSAWSPSSPSTTGLTNGPVSRCLEKAPALSGIADPVRASGNKFFSAGDADALAVLADFGDQTATANGVWNELTHTASGCENVTVSAQRTWDGAEAISYSLSSPAGTTEQLWLARTDSTFGMLWLANAPEPVPSAVDTAVMTAIVSALQWPASYQDVGSVDEPTATASSAAVVGYPTVSDAAFTQAIGGWATAWRPRGTKTDYPGLPCVRDPDTEGTSGMGTGLGGNGAQEYDTFDNAADAATTAAARVAALRSCQGATYDVHTVATTGGGKVDVAVGSSSQDSVIWMVQDGPAVGYIQVPAGTSPPPDAVSAAVGDLLLSKVTHPHVGGSLHAPSSSAVKTH